MKKYQSIRLKREDIAGWQTTLEQFRLETMEMKNELSDIIRKEISANLVENAEYFQQRLLQKDQLLDLLRLDVNKLSRLMNADDETEDLPLFKQIASDMKKLATEFKTMRQYFQDFAQMVPGP